MNLKKKIITSLGVAVMAMAMFFNTTNVSNNSDLELRDLIGMNTANAELQWGGVGSNLCVCKSNHNNECLASNFITARLICGNGATDNDCKEQQTIYPDINSTFCKVYNN
jgi:hypothetical protein